MKKLRPKKSAAAFTLIELLVVIAIIGILAGLVVGIAGIASRKSKLTRTQAELALLKSAIETYKGKRGHYPPDNPNNTQTNALYYELTGTTNGLVSGVLVYITLDDQDSVSNLFSPTFLGVDGLANSATVGQSDDAAGAESFLKNLRPTQSVAIPLGGTLARILTAPVAGPDKSMFNPWHYNSHSPTNNSDSYDLWAEILIGSQTYIIGNWSDKPIVK